MNMQHRAAGARGRAAASESGGRRRDDPLRMRLHAAVDQRTRSAAVNRRPPVSCTVALPGSVICDPEELGFGLQRMLPGAAAARLPGLRPAWRQGVFEALDLVARVGRRAGDRADDADRAGIFAEIDRAADRLTRHDVTALRACWRIDAGHRGAAAPAGGPCTRSSDARAAGAAVPRDLRDAEAGTVPQRLSRARVRDPAADRSAVGGAGGRGHRGVGGASAGQAPGHGGWRPGAVGRAGAAVRADALRRLRRRR